MSTVTTLLSNVHPDADQRNRRLSLRILNHQERRRRDKVRPKPNIRPRTQVFTETALPPPDTFIPTRNNNLTEEDIQDIKSVKHPPIKTMQIRRKPNIPRMKSRNGTARTMTTYSLPIPNQSIPPRLGEPFTPNTLKNIGNRLETSTKEQHKRKRGVDKKLGTVTVNLITLRNTIQPARAPTTNGFTSKSPVTNT